MKNKKFFSKKLIGLYIGIIVIALIAAIVAVFTIGNVPDKELIAAIDTAWNSAKLEDQPKYLSELDKLSSYKVNLITLQDDRYIISVTVTAPDLGGKLSELDFSQLPQNNNPDEINTFLVEQIKSAPIQQTDTEIYAYKINGEYHISFSDEFADAMSGNLYKYSQNLYREILQKYEEGKIK